MSTEDFERDVLDFDPFEGDFGEQGDTVITNKMVNAAKEHKCCHCKCTITKGERHRCQTGKYDGELMTHRWCAACCQLMACIAASDDQSSDDDDDCDASTDAVLAYEQRATQEKP